MIDHILTFNDTRLKVRETCTLIKFRAPYTWYKHEILFHQVFRSNESEIFLTSTRISQTIEKVSISSIWKWYWKENVLVEILFCQLTLLL
jgi:hypothetical protein